MLLLIQYTGCGWAQKHGDHLLQIISYQVVAIVAHYCIPLSCRVLSSPEKTPFGEIHRFWYHGVTVMNHAAMRAYCVTVHVHVYCAAEFHTGGGSLQ